MSYVNPVLCPVLAGECISADSSVLLIVLVVSVVDLMAFVVTVVLLIPLILVVHVAL